MLDDIMELVLVFLDVVMNCGYAGDYPFFQEMNVYKHIHIYIDFKFIHLFIF